MCILNRLPSIDPPPFLVDREKPPIAGDIHHVPKNPSDGLAVVALTSPTPFDRDDNLRRTPDSAAQLTLDG
jgi:hypothetical protein